MSALTLRALRSTFRPGGSRQTQGGNTCTRFRTEGKETIFLHKKESTLGFNEPLIRSN